MSKFYWMIWPLFFVLYMMSACTEAELCDAHDGHNGNIRFDYDWSVADGATLPDSMAVMAVRVINHYKRGMMVSTENLRGHYFYNAPDDVVGWIDPSIVPPEPPAPRTDNNYTIDPTEPNNGGDSPDTFEPEEEGGDEPETPSETIEVDHFQLPNGTYKFYAMSMDKHLYDHIYTNVQKYMETDGTGMQYDEVEFVYNTHRYHADDDGNIDMESLLGLDYNQGFDIIKTNYPPVFVGLVDLTDVADHAEMAITCAPRLLTQNIDINFDIEKDVTKYPFVVESVVGEISGIPSKCSLFDGHLYLKKTNKMQFTTTLINESGTPIVDDESNTKVRVHANINVLSILHSSKPTDLTGPGILQLSLSYKFKRPNDDGTTEEVVRKVFGKVNLYHVLKQANLIEYSSNMQYATKSCDHAVLNIPGVMKLNPEGIASGNGDGGFSSWEQIDDPDYPVETDDGTQPELY
jgi:hypothetical protein